MPAARGVARPGIGAALGTFVAIQDPGAWALLIANSRARSQGARRSGARTRRYSASGRGRRHDVRLPPAGMGGGAEPARPGGHRPLRRRAGRVRREALRDRTDRLRLAAPPELARRAGAAPHRRVLCGGRADALGDSARGVRPAAPDPRAQVVGSRTRRRPANQPPRSYPWRTSRRTRTTDAGSARISGSPVAIGISAWCAVATANASA